jgi:hypothetical protein
MPVLLAGGVCRVVADLVLVDLAAGVEETGVAAGAGVDAIVFVAGAGAGVAVVEALGAADALAVDAGGVAAVSVVVDFLEWDFFAVVEESAVAAVPVDEAAGALELVAGAWSAVAAVFLDLLDFFVVAASEAVDWSPAAAVESADFVDLDFFFEVVVAPESAGGVCDSLEGSVVEFLLLLDFLVLEVSEVEVLSSAVVDFFFFLDLVVLVSLWSAGGCVDGCCAVDWLAGGADDPRSLTPPASKNKAASKAT